MGQRRIRRTLAAASSVLALLLGLPASAQFPDVLSEHECAGCAGQLAAAKAAEPWAAEALRFAGTWSSPLTSAGDPAWTLEDFYCLVACTPEERAAAKLLLADPVNADRPILDLLPPDVRRLELACDPPGFAAQVVSPLPLAMEIVPGRLVLRYEQHNAERAVLLHAHHNSAHPASRLGTSKARFENGTLLIETSGISAGPFYDAFGGGPHSDRLHATERYTTSGDGNSLFLVLELDDPATLGKPLVLTKTWRRVPGARVLRNGCDVMSGQLEGVLAEYLDPTTLDARRR